MAAYRNYVFLAFLGGMAAALVMPSEAATGNHYGVYISTRPTKNMAFANGVYSATADHAVLNVNDLVSALNAGNVEVTTGNGSGDDEKGDLHVKAGFTWVGSYGLTLDAYHSLFFDQAVVDAGAGAVTLTNNDGGTGGTFIYGPKGNITIWDLSNVLTINGQVYTLVGDIRTLASDIAANPSGNYALASSYDASKDGTYGHAPIPTALGGTVEGLGNVISNLSVSDGGNPNVGFFASIGSTGVVRDIGLANGQVSGTVNRKQHSQTIGCLAGLNNGQIVLSFAECGVTAGGRGNVGGLIGSNLGTVSQSHAAGNVQVFGPDGAIGGLVGLNLATITNSFSKCQVVGRHNAGIGGLVGFNGWVNASATISGSFAMGDVSAGNNSNAGGLVGLSTLDGISNSYAEGNTAVGANTIGDPYEGVGGLVGSIQYSATIINSSYSTGIPTSRGISVGGMIGSSGQATFADLYWDTTTSGITNPAQGCGDVQNCPGVAPLTSQQLQSGLPAGFDPTIWAENPNINNGFPYLIANPPPQ